MDWSEQQALPSECRPRMIDAAPGVTYRGTVVLLHGYEDCPQQFLVLADLLAVQGYRTILPVLPGQGVILDEADGAEAGSSPTRRNWRAHYELLADHINGIMAWADGDRVIGGQSVGGSASLYVNLRARDQYARHIIFSPQLAPAGGQLTPLGSELQRELRSQPLAVRLQFVGTENDTIVSNNRNRDLLAWQMETGLTSACFFPAGVPHAMVSDVEQADADAYWLDALEVGAVRFIRAGEAFPTNGQVSPSESPFEQCLIDVAKEP